MKVIALDYDDTYTADPDLWRGFVEAAQSRGHLVVMVTARFGTHDQVTGPADVEVIYTGGKTKRASVQEQGVPMPDIWIDDMPEII